MAALCPTIRNTRTPIFGFSLAAIGLYLSHRGCCRHLVLLEALGQHVVLSIQPLQDLVKFLTSQDNLEYF